MTAEEWLKNEDEKCRDDRLRRLNLIVNAYPDIDIALFHGGQESYRLFEEARYCFVYGQFIASIILGLVYIEKTIASLFYASGRDDLQRASATNLLKMALNEGLISENEYSVFNDVRRIRNPILHFRNPMDKNTVDYKAFVDNRYPYEILEDLAITALTVMIRMLEKCSV